MLSAQVSNIVLESQLKAEILQLKEINKKLQAEYDSLLSIHDTVSKDVHYGYCVRLVGNFTNRKEGGYIINKNIVSGRYVYSIHSFSNPHDAYRMAQDLRALKPKDFSIVQKESNFKASLLPENNTLNKSKGTMEIDE